MKEKKLFEKILSIGEEVFNELGGGFNENVHQVGLAIEFREAPIKYLRETNIEIFYKRERRHSTLGYCSPAAFEQYYYLKNQLLALRNAR